MLRYRFIISFFAACLFCLSANAEFKSAESMEQVSSQIEEFTQALPKERVLVAFDIDMTLTHSENPAAQYQTIKKYADIFKKTLEGLSPEQKDLMLTTVVTKHPQQLVEEKTSEIIRNLQDEGFKTIALTASLTGDFTQPNDKFTYKRRDDLKRLGIDFSKSFKNRATVVTFTKFQEYAQGYPMFYHGVLCANGENNGIGKGPVLDAFLKQIRSSKDNRQGYIPNVIIMVDDRKKNLENVQKYLDAHYPDLKFLGIEYRGALNVKSKDISATDFEKFWEKIQTSIKVS